MCQHRPGNEHVSPLDLFTVEAYNGLMRSLIQWLSRRNPLYEPLIDVEISAGRLINNLNEFRKLAPQDGIAPVLKSNAYGHGLVEVARILEKENQRRSAEGKPYIPFFVVDSFYEATVLRRHGIKTHILIIGYTRPETIIKTSGYNTSYTVTNMSMLRDLCKREDPTWNFHEGKLNWSNGIKFSLPMISSRHNRLIHLKIDTGMHRQGIMPIEIPEAIELIKRTPYIILEGVCSHLGDADNTDETFTESQLNVWNNLVKQFKTIFPTLKYYHFSNTDGHRLSKEIDANVSRLGIGLYGLSGDGSPVDHLNLKPVLSMKTIITGVKQLARGGHVGYSKTFMAPKDMIIATIPVGYFEGLDRRLSNRGVVLVNDKPCPIIGRISMNISVIDITTVSHELLLEHGTLSRIHVGDNVLVISDQTRDPNSVSSFAKLCDTITYDIVCKIPAQLKRVVVE